MKFKISSLLFFALCLRPNTSSSWDEWWAYEGISGPNYWGLLNPEWILCNKGKHQSPINIIPEKLVFDPSLSRLKLSSDYVNGSVRNTGRGILLKISKDSKVVISDGPLSYDYRFEHILLHYGHENSRGSEHRINGFTFAGELQLYAYNTHLYSNWSEAEVKSHGIMAIAILIKLTNYEHPEDNQQLLQMIHALKNLSSKTSQSQQIYNFSISDLLSESLKYYITYEGSLTKPSCSENVQWIILNKPIYISGHQLRLLRNLMESKGLGDNFRPIQPLSQRCVRTNIDFNNVCVKV
ncbi:carbonic anhydrase-related protein 10-like protein [Dinothrombium tinctorium]|uniref:Carbonic anhydrase-related protein 10-like protein n=1 Tax=Dinothrombium tinctorium TaxID=1965070 RepID=A0A3S3SQU0_9ACAR|nr:carbonic anhydrase-related protein 10-like protein [Dinothrombium tinctorium]